MKKLLSLFLSLVVVLTAMFALPAAAQAKTKVGSVKNIKIKAYDVRDRYSWESEESGGFACYVVKFDKVKGASGYQVKYYWVKDEVYKKNIKKNYFHYGTQDIMPTCKVRAYKKTKSGKKIYGAWKTVKWKGKVKWKGTLYYDQYEKKIESKYPLV